MIVKFMASSSTMAAVEYNDKRVKNGEAELIGKRNFPFNDPVEAADYLNIFNIWNESNDRIRKPQLHVVFSAPDKDTSKEELLKLGEEWMKRMGYGDNPYLIYYHHNTEHSHIHIVSTRIDPNGKKVNDSLEGERGNKVMNEILGLREEQKGKIEKDVKDALGYSFENYHQFKLILQQQNYKVTENDDTVTVKKNGEEYKLNMLLIDNAQKAHLRNMDLEVKRKKRAIIRKYACMLKPEDFKTFMRNTFGMNFVFFQKPDKDKPYGYAIIDHKEKMVVRGSDMVPLTMLMELLEQEVDEKERFDCIILETLRKNKLATSLQINRALRMNGGIYKAGEVFDTADGSKVMNVREDLVDIIKENDLIDNMVRKYSGSSDAVKRYVLEKYGIDVSLVKWKASGREEFTDFRAGAIITGLVESMDGSFSDSLSKNGIQYTRVGDEYVFDDRVTGEIYSNVEIGLDAKEVEKVVILEHSGNDTDNETLYSGANDLVYGGSGAGSSGEDPNKKRKRR